ncbi:MAG: hypothetical protein II670_02110 [Alphaproteobacteria bacterium]|nr:hypothetical protein [Alphaproteobacteria bacterium]
MNALFTNLKKIIDNTDRMLASDYLSYFGIDESEAYKYADEFVAICYDYNEETGEHEPKSPDNLTFAIVTYPTDHSIKYTYGGQSVTKIYLG